MAVADDINVDFILYCSRCREIYFQRYPDLKAAFDSQDPDFESKAREKVKEFIEEVQEKEKVIRQAFNSLPESEKTKAGQEFMRILTNIFKKTKG